MTNTLQVDFFVKVDKIPPLRLNEIDKKSRATVIFGNFLNNP